MIVRKTNFSINLIAKENTKERQRKQMETMSENFSNVMPWRAQNGANMASKWLPGGIWLPEAPGEAGAAPGAVLAPLGVILGLLGAILGPLGVLAFLRLSAT